VKPRLDLQEAEDWLCDACNVALELGTVEVAYLGSKYPVELPKCPICGLVYIPEQLALGQMADIEKILEDK
jgi:hypothetical protein